MRKVQFMATFWTFVIAIPFTVLALIGVAYLTENLTQIINAIIKIIPGKNGKLGHNRDGQKKDKQKKHLRKQTLK